MRTACVPRYRSRWPCAAALGSGASLDGIRARPEPAVWSALEYVVHLRAALGFYADRIRRTLAEDRPRLTAYGFGAACERDDYNGEEPNTAIAGLRSAANAVSHLLDGLTPAEWHRVAIGSEGDERTVLALADGPRTKPATTPATCAGPWRGHGS